MPSSRGCHECSKRILLLERADRPRADQDLLDAFFVQRASEMLMIDDVVTVLRAADDGIIWRPRNWPDLDAWCKPRQSAAGSTLAHADGPSGSAPMNRPIEIAVQPRLRATERGLASFVWPSDHPGEMMPSSKDGGHANEIEHSGIATGEMFCI